MQPNLSFEQAPPISVPLRFLLTAPWFGVAAGLMIAATGDIAILSRWAPETLAIVHLLVAGFLLQAMSGALFQFVPVAAGGNVWRPRALATLLHPALLGGALLLVAGLYFSAGGLLRVGGALLLGAVTLLVAVVGLALMRTPASGPVIVALRFAVGGLAMTVLLGGTLAEALAGAHAWPVAAITNLHAAWGLGGWVLMLVVGVSGFVVPMFQLTPAYPVPVALWVPRALVVLLVGGSLQLLYPQSGWLWLAMAGGLAATTIYALATLRLQARRRRKVIDATLLFFRGGMLCLLGAVAAGTMAAVRDEPLWLWWFGVLGIGGGFVSLVNGMAYKIVPFLSWLHLQRAAGIGGEVPNMREMIAESAQRRQQVVHFVAVALLVVGGLLPVVLPLAGLAFAASNVWFGWNLWLAARRYRGFKDRMRVAAPCPGS